MRGEQRVEDETIDNKNRLSVHRAQMTRNTVRMITEENQVRTESSVSVSINAALRLCFGLRRTAAEACSSAKSVKSVSGLRSRIVFTGEPVLRRL